MRILLLSSGEKAADLGKRVQCCEEVMWAQGRGLPGLWGIELYEEVSRARIDMTHQI